MSLHAHDVKQNSEGCFIQFLTASSASSIRKRDLSHIVAANCVTVATMK